MSSPKEQPRPRRVFQFSSKEDHSWFAAHSGFQKSPYEVRDRVSHIIDQNAHELFGATQSWTDVASYIRSFSQGKNYTGIPALTYSLSLTMLSVARRMGWGGNSPEFVYMSGHHYAYSISNTLADLNKRIQATEEGKRQFVSPEVQAQTLEREKAEARKIAGYKHRMDTAIAEYVQQYLPQGEQYLEVLRFLPYASTEYATRAEREKILTLFEKRDIPGNLERAYQEVIRFKQK